MANEPDWLKTAREKGLVGSEIVVREDALSPTRSRPNFQFSEEAKKLSAEQIDEALSQNWLADKEARAGLDVIEANAKNHMIRVAGEMQAWALEEVRVAVAAGHLPGLPPISEDEFQAQVIQLAKLRGWLVAHFRPAIVLQDGRPTYRTPVQADGKGFPDLVLVRDRVIFAELKSDTGKVSDEQDNWLTRLTYAGADSRLWRPKDWPEIENILT